MIDNLENIVAALQKCSDGICSKCYYRDDTQDCQSLMLADAVVMVRQLLMRIVSLEAEVKYWMQIAEDRKND